MFYSYQHAGLLTGVPCWATSPPVMHWQVLVYARSITNHLGFEPGVTWLSGVTAQLCAMGCSVKVHKERQRKGSQVVSNQSNSPCQVEEDLGTSQFSVKAWTRMLQEVVTGGGPAGLW